MSFPKSYEIGIILNDDCECAFFNEETNRFSLVILKKGAPYRVDIHPFESEKYYITTSGHFICKANTTTVYDTSF